jgi:hypothetical protein
MKFWLNPFETEQLVDFMNFPVRTDKVPEPFTAEDVTSQFGREHDEEDEPVSLFAKTFTWDINRFGFDWIIWVEISKTTKVMILHVYGEGFEKPVTLVSGRFSTSSGPEIPYMGPAEQGLSEWVRDQINGYMKTGDKRKGLLNI